MNKSELDIFCCTSTWASNQAKSVVDRAKQDATGGKYNGEETERQIEHYIQRSTQIRDFIGSKTTY